MLCARFRRAHADLIASFQRSVVANLVSRTLAAAEQYGARTVLVSGGVAANCELRRAFEAEAGSRGIEVFLPQPRAFHRQCRHDRRRRAIRVCVRVCWKTFR